MTLLALLPPAVAAERSIDIELFHPRFGGGVPGVETVEAAERGTLHAGVLVQYTRDPLVLYDREDIGVAVVRDRATVQVGGRWQLWEPVALRLSMPVIADGGGEDPARSVPGVGVGDLWLGAVADLAKLGPVRVGAHLDLAVPTGTREAWRGDASIRGVPGALAEARFGRLGVSTQLSAVLRPPVDTGDDLVAGVDLLAHVGASYDVWRDKAAVTAALLDRIGLAEDGGAPATELLVGLRARLHPVAELDAHLGRGLTLGYGAPDFRVGVGLTVTGAPARPREPEPLRIAVVEVPEAVEAPEPEVVAVEATPPVTIALARVEQDEIVLSDPIQFELGTDRILPVSLPTLKEVAALLQSHPEIAQLVIEGHASEEGSYLYNYDLSLRRASAIFKELVLAGVHPDRLSCRAMGEVAPAALGADEAALARSRRVVFRIARRLQPGEELPPYTRDIRLPWNGEATTLPEPPPLPAPPPPPPPDPDDLPDPDLFEEDE